MKILPNLLLVLISYSSTIYSAGSNDDKTIAEQCDIFAKTYHSLCLTEKKDCDVAFIDVNNYSPMESILYVAQTFDPIMQNIKEHYQRIFAQKKMKLKKALSTEHLTSIQNDPMYKKEKKIKRSDSASSLIRQASANLAEEQHLALSLCLVQTYLELQTTLDFEDNTIGQTKELLIMLGEGAK